MRRRDFLIGLPTALAAAHALPRAVFAELPPSWAIGFAGVESDLAPLPMSVQGRLPAPCQGTLFRNGPALYQRAGQRYGHWFDPDGMIQAFRFAADQVVHQGRFVRTERLLKESAAGRFLFNGAGSKISGAMPERNNETLNVANINVQLVGDELLALWEAGSAYRVDPDSLETLGVQHWSKELAGVPFSAHPRTDESGNLWNIGSASFAGSNPRLVLYQISAAGQLKKFRVHPLDFAGYMHDFILTPRYMIALNSSAVSTMTESETFVGSIKWMPEQPSQLLVFDRQTLDHVKTIEVPATFVFHFGNAWEEKQQIEWTACAYPNSNFMTIGMARLAQQQPGPYYSDLTLVRYRLDLNKSRCQIEPLDVDLEFPAFDRRAPFSPQPLYGASGSGSSASGLSTAVMRIDPRSGDAQRYDYGPDYIVEEPQLIGGDYLMHSFLDHRRGRSGVAILRTAALADGPILLAEMERILPLGFHGCFVAAA